MSGSSAGAGSHAPSTEGAAGRAPTTEGTRSDGGARSGAMARVGAVARLELTSTLRRPLWWVLLTGTALIALSMWGTAFLPRGDGSPGAPMPFNNSVFALTAFFGLSAMVLYTLFAAVLGGLSVLADDEHRISPLLHSTPLRAHEYVLGKYAGVLGSLVVILFAHVLLAMLAREGLGASVRGPFQWSSYAGPAVLMALPAIVLFSGIAFAVGERWRRPLLVFAVPLALLFALPVFIATGEASGAIEALLVLFDPSGLRWFLTRGLGPEPTVALVNEGTLRHDVLFWANRAILLAAGLGAVGLSMKHCAKVVRGADERAVEVDWDELEASSAQPDVGGQGAFGGAVERLTTLADLAMSGHPPGLWKGTFVVTMAHLRELANQPAPYLFALLCAGVVWSEAVVGVDAFGDPRTLLAGALAVRAHFLLTFLICAVQLFVAVEMLHREEASGVSPLALSCPVRTGSLLGGAWLSGTTLALGLIGVAAIAGTAVVALQTGRIQPTPFVALWILGMAPTVVLWQATVLALWSRLRSRYTVYAVGLALLLLTERSLRFPGMSWLYNWTAVGTLRWSDVAGIAPHALPWLLNRVLVLSLAAGAWSLALRWFARTERDVVGRRAAPPSSRPSGRPWWWVVPPGLVGGAAALALWAGIRAGEQGPAARSAALEYRRLNAEAWRGAPLPELQHVAVQLDVRPYEGEVAVRGRYHLHNSSNTTIQRLPFTVRPWMGKVAWSMDGSVPDVEDRSGLHVLVPPDGPLAPGAERVLEFEYTLARPGGFTRNGGGLSQFILEEGMLLHTLRESFLPVLGVVEGIGLTRASATVPAEWADDFWRHQQRGPRAWTAVVEVTAPSDYPVVAVGTERYRRETGGRVTTRWEGAAPLGAIVLVGGPLQELREGSTSVHFHRAHRAAAEGMLPTLVVARRHFSEWFGPYPWESLRVTEYPGLNVNAMGFPTHVAYSEGLGFQDLAVGERPPGFFVLAHEVAHQWWGNRINAGEGPGTLHVVEGMANWAGVLLTEELLGTNARQDLLRELERNYLRGRRIDRERPVGRMLGDEGADRAIVYDKGAWVQWMLQEEMGRTAMRSGLRAFVERYSGTEIRPTLQDLLSSLRGHAPDTLAFDRFVDQWFFRIVVPEIRITDVSVEDVSVEAERPQTSNNGHAGERREERAWLVRALVANVGTGDVEVDVALLGADDQDTRRVRVAPGRPTSLEWHVRFEPREFHIDPDVRLLQRNRSGPLGLPSAATTEAHDG